MKNLMNPAKVWFIKLICLGVLILFALVSRFTANNWDSGNHLHPDERFLTMVTEKLSWPNSWQTYFTTGESPLNPHNYEYDFYVYGQWPLFLVKIIAQSFGLDDYGGITLVGRGTSAFFEFGTFLLVILIGAQLASKKHRFLAGLLSGLSYVCFTLPIQMAHYYVVDPYLVFSLVTCFFLLIQKPSFKVFLGVGVSFGLAVSAKISAIYFAPIIGLRIFQLLWQKTLSLKKAVLLMSIMALTAAITLRVMYPMLFEAEGFWPSSINPQVISNWKSLKAFDGKDTQFPPALQWIPTTPITYLFSQTAVWGVGLPLTIIAISVLMMIWKNKKEFGFTHAIWPALFWVLLLTTYQSLQFAKTLRYIYPMLPFLAVVIGATLTQIEWSKYKKTGLVVGGLFILGIWWSWSFQSIYRRPHSRIAASSWIYQNIPPNSALSYEYWDDALPLSVVDSSLNAASYRIIELSLYDPDSQEKWFSLSNKLSDVDYVVLSSNRLWRSLSALPKKYPTTAHYYKLLFEEKMGFTKVAQFSSYPCLLPMKQTTDTLEPDPPLQTRLMRLTQTNYCAIAIANDGAEEAVTVYDHPVVLIFKNTGKFTPEEIRRTLMRTKYH